MNKFELSDKTIRSVYLSTAALLVFLLLLGEKFIEIDELLGLGIFAAAVLAGLSWIIRRIGSSNPKNKNKHQDNLAKSYAFFKTAALVGGITGGLIWLFSLIVESLDINTGSNLGEDILAAIWFYAGLGLAAVSLLAMAVLSIIAKKRESNSN